MAPTPTSKTPLPEGRALISPAKQDVAVGSSGFIGPPSVALAPSIEHPAKTKSGGGKGRIHRKVHDRFEEYAYVTPDDLREAWSLGWFQHALTAVGTFFLSGAFWLLIDLIVRESEKPAGFKFTAWMFGCVLSIIFGGAMAVIGTALFRMKQRRLSKYFPRGGAPS